MNKERKEVDRADEEDPRPPTGLRRLLTDNLAKLYDLVSDDQNEVVERMRRKRYGKKS